MLCLLDWRVGGRIRQKFQCGFNLSCSGYGKDRKIIGMGLVERYFVSKIPAPEFEILFLLGVTYQKVEPVGQVAQAFLFLRGQHALRG